ncbi:hypothetical protein PAJ34TS1_40080 [Paenibacillus azoreducens]|uniref:Uncharacterized protein n=1 Tax=Paenibacillus azoreducens TaxID=116718 RepID=A0A920CQ44_9BACL|nr:hypothetical protein J34TS1_03890 [Paenibacillus azoreducens]
MRSKSTERCVAFEAYSDYFAEVPEVYTSDISKKRQHCLHTALSEIAGLFFIQQFLAGDSRVGHLIRVKNNVEFFFR